MKDHIKVNNMDFYLDRMTGEFYCRLQLKDQVFGWAFETMDAQKLSEYLKYWSEKMSSEKGVA